MPEGRRSDPAAIKSFLQTEKEQAALEPDGVLRAARYSQINAVESQLTETYVKPVQEQRSLWYTQQLAKTQGDEAARNRLSAQLESDLAAGLVTSATATSIQTTLSAQGSKEVRTYDKDINGRVDKMSKEWEAYSGSPNSYGGSTVDGFESQALYKARDDARRKSQEVVYQAIKEGKDPVQALNQLWTNSNFGLRRREEVGGTQAPMYENGSQLMQKNTGNWSRSSIAPRDASNLRGQSRVRPLYGADPFAADVDAFLNGAPSQNFRTLMKTLTTGTGGQKPSEVILNQFRLMGIEVPEDQRQRIQTLDGQEISMATPARRPTPQQNGALAGIQIVGGTLGNLLVPPAQARTTPPTPTNSFPSRVTEVGYYAGGGGQDGVAGGRTANGEIYNPKKMTVAVQWTLRNKLLNKWLLVQDSKSGKTVRVWANDVGPLLGDNKKTGARHLDLSSAAFTKLFGSTRQGLGDIKYKVDPNQSGRP